MDERLRQLKHYRILELLAAGGMGEVYAAHDTRLDRRIALKILPAEVADDRTRIEQFRKEALALAALSHPNIVTIYSVEEEAGLSFITMELVAGRTLDKIVQEADGLDLPTLVGYAGQLAAALAAAHERGIVHRDVKPANAMVSHDGRVKVLDFGVAKLRRSASLPDATSASTAGMTAPGSIVGTLPYMSPEQAQGRPIDHRSDIFSFGVVLYEMATGRRPFDGATAVEIASAILSAEPAPLRDLRPDLPVALARLIDRCLRKRPGDRHADMAALMDDLGGIENEGERSDRGRAPKLRTAGRRLSAAGRVAVGVSLLAAASLMIWRVAPAWLSGRDAELAPAAVTRLNVAVNPFLNNTGDESLDWLDRGLPDMLTNALDKSRLLRIVAPTAAPPVVVDAASPVGGRGPGAVSIAVVGSIIRQPSGYRIMVRAERTSDGELIIADSTDVAELERIPVLMDQLAGRVRVTLEIEAAGSKSEQPDVSRLKTSSLEAYRNYFAGLEGLGNARYQDAIADLLRAIELDGCFAHAYDRLANAYLILGSDELAIRAIDRALDCGDRLSEVEATVIRRRRAQVTGDVVGERRYLRRLVLLEPDNAERHFSLGWHIQAHDRSCPGGIGEYRRALELDPAGRPSMYSYLGYAYLACGRTVDALRSYEAYVSLRPQEPEAYRALGYAHLIVGDYETSERHLRRALELDDDFPNALRALGDYYLQRGMARDAIAAYERFLSVATGPDERETGRVSVAQAYLAAGRLERATNLVAASGSDDQADDLHRLWVRGRVELAAGDVDAAAATTARMRAVRDQAASSYLTEYYHHLHGLVLVAQGVGDEGIGELRAAVEIPTLVQVLFRHSLAEALVQVGDTEGAERTLLRNLQDNPAHAPSLRLLGDLYRTQGRTNEALERYEQFLAVWKNANGGIEATLDEVRATTEQLRGE